MATTISKLCEQCGASYDKTPNISKRFWKLRRFCTPECKRLSQIGQTGTTKGMKFPERTAETLAKRKYRKCCVCKGPTKFPVFRRGSKNNSIQRCCDNTTCKDIVRLKKNKHIRKVHLEGFKTGKRKPSKINRAAPRGMPVSKEELLMTDWFISQGWTPQHYINTGVRRLPKLPPFCFDLDFALVDKKLYVEIDGSIHQHAERKIRDARRTEILSGLGWRGLRVSANRIISKLKRKSTADIEGVKREVMHFSKT
jgi:hypothetical protein